jgi:secreted PhoX family phosphatase
VRDTGELAGVCFAPDGSTLFFNLQREGVTVAITGPWPRS